jgi:hypothetical protein
MTWMRLSRLQELPFPDSGGPIHPQKFNRDAARRGQADDLSITNPKVVLPAINSRMEQGRKLARFRIYRSDIAAFEPVADSATQRKILQNCSAAMLYRDYMIDLVLHQRQSF